MSVYSRYLPSLLTFLRTIFGFQPYCLNSKKSRNILKFYDIASYFTNSNLFKAIKQKSSTHPLRPFKMNNARPHRITAAAGTKLAGAYSLSTSILTHSIFYSNSNKIDESNK
jgi:hypothetical protein